MIVHVNGNFCDAREAAVSPLDGGYLFGDGVFTTLRLYAGRPYDLTGHLERLRRQAGVLVLPCPLQREAVAEVLGELAMRNGLGATDARARLTVSRGTDLERLQPLTELESLQATVSMIVDRLPADLATWQAQGIAVCVLDASYSRGVRPELKSLCYLPSLLALRQAAAQGCQEALLSDREGKVWEGAVSNLFLVRDGCLCTPPAAGPLLAGRTRARLLALAEELKIPSRELVVPREALDTAEEIFLTGSVKEVVPIVRMDERPVGNGRPGAVTRRLQEAYRLHVQQELAETT